MSTAGLFRFFLIRIILLPDMLYVLDIILLNISLLFLGNVLGSDGCASMPVPAPRTVVVFFVSLKLLPV